MSVVMMQILWLSQHLSLNIFFWLLFSEAVAYPTAAELNVLFLSDGFEQVYLNSSYFTFAMALASLLQVLQHSGLFLGFLTGRTGRSFANS